MTPEKTMRALGLCFVFAACSDDPEPIPARDLGPPDSGVGVTIDAAIADIGMPDIGSQDLGEDAGPAPDMGTAQTQLIIEGAAPAGFSVTVSVGGDEVRATAGRSGRYQVELSSMSPDAVVSVRARGLGSQDRLELGSLLDTVQNMVALSGGDGVLDDSEYAGTRLSVLTTVRYGLLLQANGGRLPATRAEIEAADWAADEPSQLDFVVLAGLLDQVFTTPATLLPPAAPTTLAVASDATLAQLFVEGYSSQERQDAARALSRRQSLFAPTWDEGGLRGQQFMTRFRSPRRGSVPQAGGERWQFGQRGRGVLLTEVRLDDGVLTPNPDFSWVLRSQAVGVTFIPAARTEPAGRLTVDDIVASVNDPARTPAIRQYFANRAVPDVMWEQTATELFRVPGGAGLEWVVEVQKWTYLFSQAFRGTGLDLPDVPAPDQVVGHLWRNTADIQTTPFTEAMLRGRTWLLQIVGSARYPRVIGGFAAGDPVLQAAVVRLNDDRAGTVDIVHHGFTTPPVLTWSRNAQGELELSYPDGTTQTFVVVHRVDAEVGLLSNVLRPGGPKVQYFRAVEVDPTLMLASDRILTPPGRYWQTTLSRDTYVPQPGQALARGETFGFELDASGMARRLYFRSPQPDLFVEDFWTHAIEPRAIVFTTHRSAADRLRCADPEDPSCIVARRRTWIPLREASGRLYVLERSAWRPLDMRWDGMAWVDGAGNPLAEDAFAWLFSPRVNAYFLTDRP